MSKTDEIAADLPGYLPRSPESNWYRFLVPLANQTEAIEADIESMREAAKVQTATSIGELEELAKLVGESYEGTDSIETFRVKTLAAYQTLTCEGTANEILENAAEMLGISPDSMTFVNDMSGGNIQLRVPTQALDSSSITTEDFSDILSDQIAAGFRLDATVTGTLQYISEAEYLAGDYDPAKGYDSLGGDGNGGTYSGLL